MSHTYVECCDRQVLTQHAHRIYLGDMWVHVCRNGHGCTTELLKGQS